MAKRPEVTFVLVIEDDDEARGKVVDLLEKAGIATDRIREAATASEARRCVKESGHRLGYVSLDLGIPEETDGPVAPEVGVKLFHDIKDQTPALIVPLSVYWSFGSALRTRLNADLEKEGRGNLGPPMPKEALLVWPHVSPVEWNRVLDFARFVCERLNVPCRLGDQPPSPGGDFLGQRSGRVDRSNSSQTLDRAQMTEAASFFERLKRTSVSKRMQDLLERIQSYSGLDATILILGETGVGKELVAHAIHELSGRKGSFVIENAAGFAAGVFESELFGHKKGAFSDAVADRGGLIEAAKEGTLFLDEIGDLSLQHQAKLLRTLQDRVIRRVGDDRVRRVDFRLVSATNRNLQEMVANGEFREDMFYRLEAFTLEVPPLRERPEVLAPA